MNFEKMQYYENKIRNKVNDPLDNMTEYITKKDAKLMKEAIRFDEKLLLFAEKISVKVIRAAEKFEVMLTPLATYFKTIKENKLARITGRPMNYLYFLYLKLKEIIMMDPLHKKGTHLIFGLQGSGKSSLAYDLAMQLIQDTGFSAYFSDPLEKSRIDSKTGQAYKLCMDFNIFDYFGSEEDQEGNKRLVQKIAFDNIRFKMIVFDEFGNKFSNRMTMTKESKAVMVPLTTSSRQMRHQDLWYIYYLHQLETIDIGLMAGLMYAHEPSVVIDIPYAEWVQKGMLVRHIKGWNIVTYKVKKKRKGPELRIYKKWFRKVEDTDKLEHFESLNQKENYSNLPKQKFKTIGGTTYNA